VASSYVTARTMHSVTDRQTDGRMMPIADHTVQQYDRLKLLTYGYSGRHCCWAGGQWMRRCSRRCD